MWAVKTNNVDVGNAQCK
jgi:hypothetical protein